MAEQKSVQLFDAVRTWMKKAESVFLQNKIPLGAQITAYRGILTSVDQDGLHPEDLAFHKTPSRVKMKRAAAMVYMQKVVQLIFSYLLQVSVAYGSNNQEITGQ